MNKDEVEEYNKRKEEFDRNELFFVQVFYAMKHTDNQTTLTNLLKILYYYITNETKYDDKLLLIDIETLIWLL